MCPQILRNSVNLFNATQNTILYVVPQSLIVDCSRQQTSFSSLEPLTPYLLFFCPGFLPLGAPVGTYFGFASPGAFFGRPRGFPGDKMHWKQRLLNLKSHLWAHRTSLALCPSPPCTSGGPSPSSSSPSLPLAGCCFSFKG